MAFISNFLIHQTILHAVLCISTFLLLISDLKLKAPS